jgi:hypothetical protein
LLSPVRFQEKVAQSGTAAIFAQACRRQNLARARNALALVLFVGASAVWLESFCRLGVSQEGMPWYLTVGALAAFSVRFLRQEEFPLTIAGLPRSREPLKLRESVALCFLSMAIALYSWVGYGLLHPAVDRRRPAQIVDIQLLSARDYQDNQELVPGSRPQQDLRARTADQVSRPGELNQIKTNQAIAPERIKRSEVIRAADLKKTDTPAAAAKQQSQGRTLSDEPESQPALPRKLPPSSMVSIDMPSSWQTKTVNQHYTPQPARSASAAKKPAANEPFISEVAPPELVELMENDGDRDALHVFQKGGKSSGGQGAENSLSTFLKGLHKRIKSSWSPPRGSTRRLVILFRLARDGRLAFLKIPASSGQSETDASAEKAITAATGAAHALPADFAAPYLDVIYTFKYNVDELQEVTSPAAGG